MSCLLESQRLGAVLRCSDLIWRHVSNANFREVRRAVMRQGQGYAWLVLISDA